MRGEVENIGLFATMKAEGSLYSWWIHVSEWLRSVLLFPLDPSSQIHLPLLPGDSELWVACAYRVKGHACCLVPVFVFLVQKDILTKTAHVSGEERSGFLQYLAYAAFGLESQVPPCFTCCSSVKCLHVLIISPWLDIVWNGVETSCLETAWRSWVRGFCWWALNFY